MPPLDDELRAALSARAATLTPPTDPFPGVARRARRMRRQRAAAAVAGTALAVLGIVGGAALVLPSATGPSSGPVASAPASPAPTAAPSSEYALDPSRPWPYRGLTLADGDEQAFLDQWAAAHPGERPATLLFGQVWEPSGQTEVVVLGERSWGVLSSSEAGPEIVSERPLPSGPVFALVDVLPGDEVPRLLAVAAPQVEELVYRPDGTEESARPLAALAEGVGTLGFEPLDPVEDRLEGVDGGQQWVVQVPDGPSSPGGEVPAAAPADVVEWPVRGAAVDPEVLQAGREAFAEARGGDASAVESKVLFSGDDDAGQRYLLAQLWLPGDSRASTVSVVLAPGSGATVTDLPLLDDESQVAVMQVPAAPGQSVPTLVVVPRPGVGQVDYAGDAASEWRPASMPSSLDGVALLDRAPGAAGGEDVDRLRLWDGDGVVLGEHAVPELLGGPSAR